MPQVRDESDAEPIHAPLPALVPAVLASSSDVYCSVAIGGSEMSWRRLLLSNGAITSAPPSTSDSERARASNAPPLPSRHDPWRFLRCVWICVIALARLGASPCQRPATFALGT